MVFFYTNDFHFHFWLCLQCNWSHLAAIGISDLNLGQRKTPATATNRDPNMSPSLCRVQKHSFCLYRFSIWLPNEPITSCALSYSARWCKGTSFAKNCVRTSLVSKSHSLLKSVCSLFYISNFPQGYFLTKLADYGLYLSVEVAIAKGGILPKLECRASFILSVPNFKR